MILRPGILEVGTDKEGYVVVNHPRLIVDEHGHGHIVFTPDEARAFAAVLVKQAHIGDRVFRK